MSQGNVEIVRRYFELLNGGGLDAIRDDPIAERIDPEIEFHEDPAFPEAGVYRGREKIEAYIEQFQTHLADHQVQVREARDLGDRVLALVHETGRGAGSGAAVEWDAAFLFSFRGGRMVRVETYLDQAKALAEAGLRK
jgi:ketosteroid isomerase-like protein